MVVSPEKKRTVDADNLTHVGGDDSARERMRLRMEG